jgi:hypothetical protein
MRAAQAVGHCRGFIIGGMLYDPEITPYRFKNAYVALKRSHELMGDEMSEFDISRIKTRAEELGVTI